MVEIECLVCKKPMEIPSCTKLEDYDGQLFCCECNLLWDVKFKSSELKKYKLAKQQPKVKPATINFISAIPRPDSSKKSAGEVKGLK